MNNNNRQHPPNKITHNNKVVTSPIQITISYSIDRINKIRNCFKQQTYDPIKLLTELIPPTIEIFQFILVTESQIIKLINKLPNSNCKGY